MGHDQVAILRVIQDAARRRAAAERDIPPSPPREANPPTAACPHPLPPCGRRDER
jgi:hypothetical protein